MKNSETSYSRLKFTIEGGIAHVQLNCPDQYNKLTSEFWHEFPDAIRAIDRDGSARVIVISALGKHFCAGLDTAGFETFETALEPGRYGAWFRENVLHIQSAFTALEQTRIPVIAAVQGACVGGAIGLISACDMRYCCDDAFFSIEETNVGITCDVGSLQRLPHIMSETHIREWVYTGKRIDAAKAQNWGLVGDCFKDQESMLAEVMKIANEISQKSPLVLHGCKLTMNYSREHSVSDGLEYVAMFNAAVLEKSEILQAVDIRQSKKPADFSDLESRIEITKGV